MQRFLKLPLRRRLGTTVSLSFARIDMSSLSGRIAEGAAGLAMGLACWKRQEEVGRDGGAIRPLFRPELDLPLATVFWFCAAAKDFLDPHRNRYSSDHYFLFGLARSDTDGLFTTGQCRRFVNIKNVAERKLAQLDAAPSVSFMKAPPGNDLKEYGGARQARINDQWRLTFKRGERGPYDVRIEDPH